MIGRAKGPPADPASAAGGRVATVAVWVLGTGWMAFWFWAFSLAYSDSYFRYSLHSRLPPFVAALVGVGGVFASAVRQWRRRGSVPVRCLRHVLGVVVSVLPFMGVAAVLHRAPQPWRPSADDAMGLGVDFLVLTGVGVASVAVLAVALALQGAWRRRRAATATRTGAERLG